MLLAGRVRGEMLDPLCGSGTIPIEAALIALGRAPGLQRGFAFERWPEHDARAFAAMKEEGRGLPSLAVRIEGSDADEAQLAAARANAERAGVQVELVRRDLRALPRGTAPIVTNPPYGMRVGAGDDLRSLWRALRDSGRRVLALSPDERPAGLAFRKLLTTQNGGLRVHLLEG
jgi:putative N6-adenine-specific DNA methylase